MYSSCSQEINIYWKLVSFWTLPVQQSNRQFLAFSRVFFFVFFLSHRDYPLFASFNTRIFKVSLLSYIDACCMNKNVAVYSCGNIGSQITVVCPANDELTPNITGHVFGRNLSASLPISQFCWSFRCEISPSQRFGWHFREKLIWSISNVLNRSLFIQVSFSDGLVEVQKLRWSVVAQQRINVIHITPMLIMVKHLIDQSEQMISIIQEFPKKVEKASTFGIGH